MSCFSDLISLVEWDPLIKLADDGRLSINQSINQYIYNVPWYRGACYSADYAEAKRNVLSRILNVLTDGAVRQFRGREFQSLGAATEIVYILVIVMQIYG